MLSNKKSVANLCEQFLCFSFVYRQAANDYLVSVIVWILKFGFMVERSSRYLLFFFRF